MKTFTSVYSISKNHSQTPPIFLTDGALIFKSNNISMWPIYLATKEPPYKKRMSRNNMIFAGMWLPS